MKQLLKNKKVQSVDRDCDGIWVYLKWGICLDFPNSGGHLIHEDTQAECLEMLKDTYPCACKECVEALAKGK